MTELWLLVSLTRSGVVTWVMTCIQTACIQHLILSTPCRGGNVFPGAILLANTSLASQLFLRMVWSNYDTE